MNENYDMATPISSLNNQRTDVNNLVKQVENNIENFNQTKENFLPNQQQPEQYTYNPNIPLDNTPPVVNQQPNPIPQYQPFLESNSNNFNNVFAQKKAQENNQVTTEPKKEVIEVEEKKPFFSSLVSNCKEFMIIVLLYSVISHKKVSKLLLTNIPHLTQFNSTIPLIILRGFIFATLFFIIKYFI